MKWYGMSMPEVETNHKLILFSVRLLSRMADFYCQFIGNVRYNIMLQQKLS